MKLKALLAAVAVATLALAGCSVDHSGSDDSKQTIRIGYQTFPSGDLIVKNNKWLEEALPEYNIKWIKFDSGADVNTAIGISRPAFAINASDTLWEKYKLGEHYKITDPMTRQPAVRNIFMDTPNVGVKALQASGTVFWQCNVALGAVIAELARANGKMPAEARPEIIAGLNPGVRIVPSHVFALGMAQERGFTYMKALPD